MFCIFSAFRLKRIHFTLLFVCLLGYAPGLAVAQNGPEKIDARPYAPLEGSAIEQVSDANGSLLVNIPVWSFKQRGNVKLDFKLSYDNPVFHIYYDCQPLNITASGPRCVYPKCPPSMQTVQACVSVWELSYDDSIAFEPFGSDQGIRLVASTDISVTNQIAWVDGPTLGSQMIGGYYWKIRTPDGGEHKTARVAPNEWRVVDGSGWKYQPTNCTAIDSDGVQYVYACDQATGLYATLGTLPGQLLYVEDTNGNRITLNYNGSNFTGWTDTVGRAIPSFRQGTLSQQSSCPTGTIGTQWHIPGPILPVTICYTSVAYHTNLYANASPFQQLNGYPADALGSFDTISALVLPSGDQWNFTYGPGSDDPLAGTPYSFGDLQAVYLPTGGHIEYTWDHLKPRCGVHPDGSLERSEVATRRLYTESGGTPSLWSYDFLEQFAVPNTLPYRILSTTTDPSNNVVKRTISDISDSGSGGSCAMYETSAEYRNSSGSLLRAESTEYQNIPYVFNIVSGYDPLGSAALPSAKVLIWPNGQQKKTTYEYNASFQVTDGSNILTIPYGIKTAEREYAYGNGSIGPLVRSTTIDYIALHQPSAMTQNLLDAKQSVTVSDPVHGGSQVTTFGYDEYALTSGNASVGWDSSLTGIVARGNLTSVTRTLDIPSSSQLTTKYSYTDTGMVHSVQLPANTPRPETTTTYDYGSTYQGAVVTSESDSLGHSRSYTYDTQTLAPKTVTDVNNKTTTYNYYSDTRLQSVVYPADSSGASAETDYVYTSPTDVLVKTKKSSSEWIAKEQFYDGLGRTISAKIFDGCSSGNHIVSDTSYDSNGRIYRQSNSYCSSDGDHAGVLHSYDGLNRPYQITNQDGTSVTYSYSGNTVDIEDEHSVHKQSTSDALGNLVEVTETDPNSGGLDLTTNYTYSAFGDLLSVFQNGDGMVTPRVRRFAYDSLSRLVFACNPESIAAEQTCDGTHWSTAYGYDAHNNLTGKTDARGVTTNYAYDVLNRLTGKTYSDGTASEFYSYDTAPSWMPDLQNVVGRMTNNSRSVGSAATFSYDAMGRVIRKWDQTPSAGAGGVFSYATYDLAGNVTHIQYPDGRAVDQEYDSAGRLNKVYPAGDTAHPYVSSITYLPDGTPGSISYGNGTVETLTKNSRLQPCKSILAPVTDPTHPFMDRRYFYSNSGNTNDDACNPVAGNNGNIYAINDALDPTHARDQIFQYDVLNRITQWNTVMAGQIRQQQFDYDSFGNINQTGVPNSTNGWLTFPTPYPYENMTWPYDEKNQVKGLFWNCLPLGTTGYPEEVPHYDASGNSLCSGTMNVDAKAYVWDADSRLAEVWGEQNNNTYLKKAAYWYDVDGNRIRSDQYDGSGNITSWREYVRFGAQVLTEKSRSDASNAATEQWTDYIYANGKRIVRVPGQEKVVTIQGTGTPSDYAYYAVTNNGGLGGYTVRSGDKLVFRQRTHGDAYGGVTFATSDTNDPHWYDVWQELDGEGQPSFLDGTAKDIWHQRTVPLETIVGRSLTQLYFNLGWDATGSGSIDYADVAVVSVDGTVATVFNNADSLPMTWWNSAGATSLSYAVQSTTVDSTATHYYASDHLGTAQMELSSYGYPVWKGEFAPFGQELSDPTSTTNRYKFTGKERDAESGLDYFGARYYGSSMGRFMSPDDGSDQNPLSPQSWNLYSYGRNNPLIGRDEDGHTYNVCPAGVSAGSDQCTNIGDKTFEAEQKQDQANGVSFAHGTITDSNGAVQGSFTHDPDIGGDPAANIAGMGSIGNQGMEAINWFAKQMVINAATDGLLGLAGRAFEASPLATQIGRNALKGAAGEAVVNATLRLRGYKIIGGQVTVRTTAGIRYVDYIVEKGGEYFAIEVKTGDAVRNASQLTKDGLMESAGGTIGNNGGILQGQTLKLKTIEMRPF